ncbi:MAG: helix-turn-helix domain-containing protein [Filifactoraceae bacterium]
MQNTSVGKIIRKIRLEKNMTQKQLANIMNISDKTVSKWERGLGLPEISLLNDLSEILGVDLASLLKGDVSNEDFANGNMKKTKFYVCPICHNILLSTGNSEISCCGRKLSEQKLQKADDNNKLIIEIIEDEWYITTNHEMKKENYISFVCFISDNSLNLYKTYPEWELELRMPKKRFGMLLWYSTTKGLFYKYFK